MKIIKFEGGLGNQMFQYAFGYALGYVNPSEIIKYNCAFYNEKNAHSNTSQRELDLERVFSIQISTSTEADISYIQKNTHRIKNKIMRRIHPKYSWQVNENPMKIYTWVFDMKQSVEYLGYWQSERYFDVCKDDIRRIFSFPKTSDKRILNLYQTLDRDAYAVSIHMRRGDYITNDAFKQKHHFSTAEYYKRAMYSMKERLKKVHFYVFSDDIVWAKEWVDTLQKNKTSFQNDMYGVIDFLDDREHYFYTMEAMSKCKHNIIAPSTFSWWGAWLNNNDEKIVIAPKKWFADTTEEYDKKITDVKIPKTWILENI